MLKTREEILQEVLDKKRKGRLELAQLLFHEKYRRVVMMQKRKAAIKAAKGISVVVWPD